MALRRNSLYTVNRWNRPLFIQEDADPFNLLNNGSNTNNNSWWSPNRNYHLTGFGTNVNNSSPYLSGSMGGLDLSLPDVDRSLSSSRFGNRIYTEAEADALGSTASRYGNNMSEQEGTTETESVGGSQGTNFNWAQAGLSTLGTGVGMFGSSLLNSASRAGAQAATNAAASTSGSLASAAAGGVGARLAQDASGYMGSMFTSGGENLLANTAGSTAGSTAAQAAGKGFAGALGASSLSAAEGAGIGAAGALVGGLAKHFISDGYSNDVGNAIADIGGPVGGVIGYFNPVIGAIVSAATGIIGGAVNRAFSIKTDYGKLAKAKGAIADYQGTNLKAKSFDDLKPLTVHNFENPYKSGWFKSASGKNEALKHQFLTAKDFAERGQENTAKNIEADALSRELANSAAYGGLLETKDNDMGAIEYDLMQDYLLSKKRQIDNKNNMTNLFMGTPKTVFDFGGTLQSNGGDYGTGLTHIDAGLSHEMNPNDGVQMGVDSEGTPNLVEEGEVVFNDYVFSNRINIDDQTKALLHFPKKKNITYADAAKKLENEIKERPNDPISEAGFKAQMQKLEEQQERQKADMEAARAREAFEALSPEEQTAVMQQAAQQEAMAQQAAQEQALAQQQQISPEEATMAQQQMMQADGSQAMIGQEPQMAACGGKLYDKGGEIKKQIYKLLNIDTDEKFQDWVKKHGNREFMNRMQDIDWEKALGDMELMQAVAGDNKSLKDALSKGYDFGIFKPEATSGRQYLWNQFWEPTNEYSKQAGNAEDKYRIDKTYKGNIKDLEASDEYKAFTDYILNNASDKERMDYFKWIDDNTGRKNKYINNGKLVDNWKEMYQAARNDGKYGIQHYVPTMGDVQREAEAQNLLWNPDTQEWNVIQGEINPAYKQEGSYTWQTKDKDNTVNYYVDPTTVKAPGATITPEGEKKPDDEWEITPNYRNGNLRYAGLFGPAVGLGLQLAGVGKPDYSGLDAAVSGAGNVALADYQPIGNYLTYRPMDIWYEQNRLNANARATDRAILNSGANQGSKAAALLASGYNDQIASGNLYRQALEYNDALRERVAGFNRGTDQFNAEAYNRNSQFNAAARNQANQVATSARLNAAAQKLDSDAGWYNSLYGNIGSLFKGIGDIGRENEQHNMIAELGADGYFGSLSPNTNTGRRGKYWTFSKKEKKSKGGKNHKKHDIIL